MRGMKAAAVAVAGMAGIMGFSDAADAFSRKQCDAIQISFVTTLRNLGTTGMDAADKVEMHKVNSWITGGCQGQLAVARRPQVMAFLDTVQSLLAGFPDRDIRTTQLGQSIRFVSLAGGPTG